MLEITCYKTLIEKGFNPAYEERKFTIWEGFKPTISYYNKDNKTGLLKLDNKKLIDITYTPDFTFMYKDILVIIEAKGIENDVFPIKKKLFRGWLESQDFKTVFFEVFNKKQLLQAIEIINKL